MFITVYCNLSYEISNIWGCSAWSRRLPRPLPSICYIHPHQKRSQKTCTYCLIVFVHYALRVISFVALNSTCLCRQSSIMLLFPWPQIETCRRLCSEFAAFCIVKRALRAVFVSIKGIYYQMELNGERILWVTPHNFSHQVCTCPCTWRLFHCTRLFYSSPLLYSHSHSLLSDHDEYSGLVH